MRVARGRGALDVAIGEGLASLAVGDRLLQLGFSGLGDYGGERLGISPRTPGREGGGRGGWGSVSAWRASRSASSRRGALRSRRGAHQHRRVLTSDGGFCQVPGSSRPAAHAHHVVYRSRGGGDEPANLVSLCAAHHLHGVHAGYVRVRGSAPGALQWELGVMT